MLSVRPELKAEHNDEDDDDDVFVFSLFMMGNSSELPRLSSQSSFTSDCVLLIFGRDCTGRRDAAKEVELPFVGAVAER